MIGGGGVRRGRRGDIVVGVIVACEEGLLREPAEWSIERAKCSSTALLVHNL